MAMGAGSRDAVQIAGGAALGAGVGYWLGSKGNGGKAKHSELTGYVSVSVLNDDEPPVENFCIPRFIGADYDNETGELRWEVWVWHHTNEPGTIPAMGAFSISHYLQTGEVFIEFARKTGYRVRVYCDNGEVWTFSRASGSGIADGTLRTICN
jgi:hypothetical protein